MNAGGTVRAVFCPVGFWDEHAAADRPAEPLAADGEWNYAEEVCTMALYGTFGQRISDLCNGNHITQKELADKIGVPLPS